MGQLTRFDINALAKNFSLSQYLETGTGEGISLIHAIACKSIKQLYSIEMDERMATAPKLHAAICEKAAADQSVSIIHGRSTEELLNVLPKLGSEPTLFFLDAHFPESDFFNLPYEKSVADYGHDSLPILTELGLISAFRRGATKDVLVIDDLFLFESGTFGFDKTDQKAATSIRRTIRSYDMFLGALGPVVALLFGHNRRTMRFYEDQGYLLILPSK
jgi:hypothetical protein